MILDIKNHYKSLYDNVVYRIENQSIDDMIKNAYAHVSFYNEKCVLYSTKHDYGLLFPLTYYFLHFGHGYVVGDGSLIDRIEQVAKIALVDYVNFQWSDKLTTLEFFG